MRNIRWKAVHAIYEEDVLLEFNERRDEFGINDESDIISISVQPAGENAPLVTHDGESRKPNYRVTIFYWSNESLG